MTNETSVCAVFDDMDAARQAIDELHTWDERVKEVKLGAIGTVAMDDGRPKPKVHLGGLFTRSLHLSDDDLATIGSVIDGGKVAVIVRTDDHEYSLVRTHLEKQGGTLSQFKDPISPEDRAAAEHAGDAHRSDAVYDKHKDDAFNPLSPPSSGRP